MSVVEKLDLLKETYADDAELDRVLEKLLDVVLNQHRLRLARYERELQDFETAFGMDSADFAARFEAGTLGDRADQDRCDQDRCDFFEWAGLYALHQDLVQKIHRLENAQ